MEIKVSKIVGMANEKSWSQVHVFISQPESGAGAEDKLASHGKLLAGLSFKVKKEDIEVSSFGTEIINRLQESFYSNESEGILKKVAQTMESLVAEFLSEVELNLVMVVMWKDYLYAGRIGGGKVFLKRGEAVVNLIEGEDGDVKVVSGEMKPKDKLMIGTRQFFEIVNEDKVKQVLEKKEMEEVNEELGSLIGGKEESSQAAGVVAEVMGEVEEIDEEEVEEQEDKDEDKDETMEKVEEKKTDVGGMRRRIKGALGGIFEMVAGLGRRKGSDVYVGKGGVGKRQKSAGTVAIVLVLIFGLSLVLAGRKRQKTKEETRYNQVIEEVGYKYDEAQGLIDLNPLRAKSILVDSKGLIEEYKEEIDKDLPDELADYLSKIEEALGRVQREYVVEQANEWFDFSLVKEGFKGNDWEIEENLVWVWDKAQKTVVEVDLETKAARVVIGGDKVKEGDYVGLGGERGMVIGEKDKYITVINGDKGTVVDEIGGEEWGRVVDTVGFGGNLYLLEGEAEGQIWKYLGVDSGVSGKRSYLSGDSYDLSEAVSMAIDGSVWVLFSDGTIAKYVRGAKDAFTVAGLDKPFNEPKAIFTSGEVDNIYVMDVKNTRVVVMSKTGEYKAQYVWPGIAGVKDLVVSENEGKMFLLTGEKVFTLELKD